MTKETVLITGASYGIGQELADLFAADGSDLVLVARSRDRLEEVAEKLRKQHGVTVHVIVQDLAAPDAAQEVFDETQAKGITVDVLVNNAGFGASGAFAELPLDRQLDMVRVNVLVLTHLTRLYLPGMLERRRGGVLNVGSTAGFQAGPTMAVYFATKAYVLHFSEAIAEEVRKRGVHVTCLAPGPVQTNFAAAAEMQKARMFQGRIMDARTAARAGHRGFRRGKVIVLPGVQSKLRVFAVRLAPRALVRKIAKYFTAHT